MDLFSVFLIIISFFPIFTFIILVILDITGSFNIEKTRKNPIDERLKMKVYKLRNKKTGLFSLGGLYPKYNKSGKIWKRMSDLKLHLSMFDSNRDKEYLDLVEIVEYEMQEV